MEKAFTVQLDSYAPLLRAERVLFLEDEKTLKIGAPKLLCHWVLFISCRTLDTVNLLKSILALLKENGVSFVLIKNQLLQYALNAGAFGQSEVGKVITIYLSDEHESVNLVAQLCAITNAYKGPIVPDTLRLGECVFTKYVEEVGDVDKPRDSIDIWKKCPFVIPKAYQVRKRKNALLGKCYIPIQLLASSPKGDIFKAINLKRFAFDWCLIKQGKPAALDDHFKREMKDRLLWQKKVVAQISKEVKTPRVIDYFERDGSGYLVMEYVEGKNFGQVIFDRLNKTTWKELGSEIKIELLNWYLMAIEIVIDIHKNGIVHRDITDSNFIVMSDGGLCIIDFELSYNLENNEPNPPFILGSYGYAAPEQLQYAIPDLKEDIYSMGALLCYLLSGLQPIKFINENRGITNSKLHRLTENSELTRIISRCISPLRRDRPEIKIIKEGIIKYLLTIEST